jgi:hypothetical protein
MVRYDHVSHRIRLSGTNREKLPGVPTEGDFGQVKPLQSDQREVLAFDLTFDQVATTRRLSAYLCNEIFMT